MAEKGTDVTATKSPLTQLVPPTPAEETITGTGLKRTLFDLLRVTNGWKPADFPVADVTSLSSNLDLFGGEPSYLSQDDVDLIVPELANARENQLRSLADLCNKIVDGINGVKHYAQMSNTGTVDLNAAGTITVFSSWTGLATSDPGTEGFESDGSGIICNRAGRYLISCNLYCDGAAVGQNITGRMTIDGSIQGPQANAFVGSITAGERTTNLQIQAHVVDLTAGQKVGLGYQRVGNATGAVNTFSGSGRLSVVEL